MRRSKAERTQETFGGLQDIVEQNIFTRHRNRQQPRNKGEVLDDKTALVIFPRRTQVQARSS